MKIKGEDRRRDSGSQRSEDEKGNGKESEKKGRQKKGRAIVLKARYRTDPAKKAAESKKRRWKKEERKKGKGKEAR